MNGYYDEDRDPLDEMDREIKFAIILTTLFSTAFLVFVIWLVSFLFFSCGTAKQKEICPAYKVYDKK